MIQKDRTIPFVILFLCTLITSACGDDGTQLTVHWSPCSLYEGQNDGRAECATHVMPLRWETPDNGRTLTCTAKRLLAPRIAKAQIWLLHGGPGASGTIGLPPFMEQIQGQLPDFDVYTLDFRGTGYSSYLGCPKEESEDSPGGADITGSEFNTCIAYLESTYGDDLEAYSFTQSAQDLLFFIDTVRETDVPVFVWGGSGGTYWAHRVLQLDNNDRLAGVVLEGMAPPKRNIAMGQLQATEAIARKILSRCSQEPACTDRTSNPESLAQHIFGRLDRGHCRELQLSTRDIRYMIQRLLFQHRYQAMLPEVLHRLDRCSQADIQLLFNLFLFFKESGKSTKIAFSTVLNLYLLFSELWHDEATYIATLDDLVTESIFAPTVWGSYLLSLAGYYPHYHDPLAIRWAQTDVPMLMLQGELDVSTPLTFARDYEYHFRRPHQRFISFPYSTHNVINGSLVAETEAPTQHCGMRLFLDFLRDPTATLDTSCLDQLLPLDFEEGSDVLKQYLYKWVL